MSDKIRLARKKDLESIQLFLEKNWSKNHIFVKNKELFLWQHQLKDEQINFAIAHNKQNNICGALGYISSNISEPNKGAWLGIWVVNKSLCDGKNTGIELLRLLINNFNPSFIAGTALSDEVINIYKFMGFKIIRTEHFFLPLLESSKIFKSSKKPLETLDENYLDIKKLIINDIDSEISEIDNISSEKLFLGYTFKMSNKDSKYLVHRYVNHPSYKYSILKIEEDNSTKSILITKEINIYKRKILRIVDVLLINFNITPNLYADILTKFIQKNNYDYLDFVVGGKGKDIAQKFGLFNRTDKDIIPNNFEPFEKKNVDNTIGYKIDNKDDFYFFKGDSDSDRPRE